MYNNVTYTTQDEGNTVTIRSQFMVLLARKQEQENRRITLVEISKDTTIDQRTLSQYARNKMKRYDAEILDKLCKYFNCQVGDLIVYVPDPESLTQEDANNG